MANGFGSLFIGASGLQNAQHALNTTANNLSNVDTKGYVRQQVRFADKDYIRLKDSMYNINMHQSGLGVSIGDVVHARDIFLDKIYRQDHGCKEFYRVQGETADYLTDLMQELHGEQFKTSIGDLWTAFQELSTHPEVTVYQNLVVEKSELIISRARNLYADFQKYQSNINEQIEDDVERVNKIGSRIYELNLEIQKIEAGGVETAMTLRDERDNLLDELGGRGSIEVKEDPTGLVYVDFEGTRFIDENRAYPIELKIDRETGFFTPYWGHLSDVDKGQYTPVVHLDKAAASDIRFDIGSLKSKLIARGDRYGVASDMDTMASYDEIAGSSIMETEAQIDKLMSSIMTAMNDIFCPNIELTDEAGNPVMQTVVVYDSNGNPVLDGDGNLRTEQRPVWVLDVENCARGSDGKLPPRELFVRRGMDRYREETINGQTYYVYNEPGAVTPDMAQNGTAYSDTQYSIARVGVNHDLKEEVSLMPHMLENGDSAFAMAQLFPEAWEFQGMYLNPYDEKPCTFQNYYDRMIGELGNEGNIYKSATETMEGAMLSMDNKRQQLMGVSSDEELTQMIKYQSAYNAASRYMTVISQMTELIVTGLGR